MSKQYAVRTRLEDRQKKQKKKTRVLLLSTVPCSPSSRIRIWATLRTQITPREPNSLLQANVKTDHRSQTQTNRQLVRTYEPAHMQPAHTHPGDFGGDWGVHWSTCKARPNSEHNGGHSQEKGGELLPTVVHMHSPYM